MGVNSIRINLDKNAIINSIKLLIGSDEKKELTFLVVEGEDDWKFFKKFIDKNVIIYESFSGKDGVSEIINNPYIQNNRVVGIRDKDYCVRTLHDRIFFYDYSCLEMMLLSDDVTHYCVCCDLYNGPEDANDLRMNILKDLKKLSLLRKYNEEENKDINFKIVSINNCIEDGYFIFDKYFNVITKIQTHIDWNEVSIYLKNYESYNFQLQDLLEISNGHDFVNYFQYICNSHRRRGIDAHHISSLYRSIFNSKVFIKTNVFKLISDYCRNESINFWICNQ